MRLSDELITKIVDDYYFSLANEPHGFNQPSVTSAIRFALAEFRRVQEERLEGLRHEIVTYIAAHNHGAALLSASELTDGILAKFAPLMGKGE